MPIQTISYLDIPVEVRQQSAAQEALRLRNLLTNPVMTVEQRNHLTQQLERLNRWLTGTLPLSDTEGPVAAAEVLDEHVPPVIVEVRSLETPPSVPENGESDLK